MISLLNVHGCFLSFHNGVKNLRIVMWPSGQNIWVSSKTLTSRPGATEERIVDGALTEQWSTPGPPWTIPENYKRARIDAEQHGAPRRRTELLGIAFFNWFMLSLYHFLGFILSFYDFIIFKSFSVPSALYNLVYIT